MSWDQADDIFRSSGVAAWLLCLACLSPAVLRFLTRRSRHLDALFATIFLLALNRLSFLLHVSTIFSHASAGALALTVAYLSTWYQRHDA